jgi:mono/diheme cytochrome c family protein
MVSLLRAVLPVIAALSIHACSDGESDPIELTPVQAFMLDPVALERGEALFAGTCAGYCHALTPGDSDASFLFDCDWQHGDGDEEIFAVVSDGIPDTRMVGFGNNFPDGDDDKWKIIAYLRANQQSCE